MRLLPLCIAVLAFSLPVHADGVTRGTVRTLANGSSATAGSAPVVASMPNGQSIVAWIENFGQATATVRYRILSDSGVPGLTQTLNTGGRAPSIANVGAGPNGFAIVYSVWDAGFTERDIAFTLLDAGGTAIGGGQANTLTNLDEDLVSASCSPGGEWAFAWRRVTVGSPSPNPGVSGTDGVYFRRFTATGAAMDSAEVRADIAGSNLRGQAGITIGFFPRRIVIAWHDGAFDAAPSAINSPDGQGQGVKARWFEPNGANQMVALTSEVLVNQITAFDQFEPLIAVSDNNRVIIGWCGDTTSSIVDAYATLYDDAGNRLVATEVNITPADMTNNQFLMGVSMSANGEAIGCWMDLPGTLGSPSNRVGFMRFDQAFNTIESGLIDSTASSAEGQALPRVGMDEYGNAQIAWQTTSATGLNGIKARRLSRQMITFTPSTANIGAGALIRLDSPSDANRNYILAASAGQGPTPLDTRTIKLDLDFVFDLSVFTPGNGIFFNNIATLDANGQSGATTANGAYVIVPPVPALSGLTIYFAFATDGGAGAPSGINTVSDTYGLFIN